MTIFFQLLDNGSGMLKTRGVVSGGCGETEFVFEMKNAESGAERKAIFRNEAGEEIYRKIKDGSCFVPTSKLCGTVSITVNERSNGELRWWRCDKVRFSSKEDFLLAIPDEDSLYETISNLRVENEQLREENTKIRKSIDELSDKLDRIMEGYDVT